MGHFSFQENYKQIPIIPNMISAFGQRCFKGRWGGGEGNLPTVWIFSLSFKARTMEKIEGE
jgi:hypothetical protein